MLWDKLVVLDCLYVQFEIFVRSHAQVNEFVHLEITKNLIWVRYSILDPEPQDKEICMHHGDRERQTQLW